MRYAPMSGTASMSPLRAKPPKGNTCGGRALPAVMVPVAVTPAGSTPGPIALVLGSVLGASVLSTLVTPSGMRKLVGNDAIRLFVVPAGKLPTVPRVRSAPSEIGVVGPGGVLLAARFHGLLSAPTAQAVCSTP